VEEAETEVEIEADREADLQLREYETRWMTREYENALRNEGAES
jgi:hypothetical protein